MKFLLFGANGWIGSKVLEILNSRGIESAVSNLRLDDTSKIGAELTAHNPTHVICTIGRTHGLFEGVEIPTIDYLEKPGKLVENIRDNLYAPLSLAMLCKEKGIHLTYLGTGCIFTYTDHKVSFSEDDEPNFFGSSYSTVKGFTDRLMHLFPETVLNVRIRMPISSDKSSRNLIMKLISYKKICSIPNSMTVLDDLLPVMVDMGVNGVTGTVNLVNPGTIEHARILDLYKEIVDPSFTYELFSYEEQRKILSSDRSNNCLKENRLKDLGYDVDDIETSVKNVLKNLS
jgi:3,5-epimerase/4-reductase